jgi:hypothetical protein
MRGYGIVGPDEGRACFRGPGQRNGSSRLTTTGSRPYGRIGGHVMPVWGIWHDKSVWFSSSVQSRKARNLRHDPGVS